MHYILDNVQLPRKNPGQNKTVYIPAAVIEEVEKVAIENDLSFSCAAVCLIKAQLKIMREK